MSTAWRALVDVHRGIEATPWGGVLLGNVWPAYFFALPLGVRILSLFQALPAVQTASTHERARLLQEFVTVLFLVLVVVLFAIRRREIRGRRATWREGLVAVVGTFLLTIVGYLPVPDTASTESLLASSAVVIVGTLFTIWALATLGRCFGMLPEVRGLVRGGPYAWVRHPVYLGEIVSAFGVVIAKPHPLVFFAWAAFAAFQYWRSIYEERALFAEYPSEYGAYRKHVPRLIPGTR
jgi:protein-S-isoprenylcysteine O-methyltransferase Ste14